MFDQVGRLHRRAGGSPLGEHPSVVVKLRFVAEAARLLALLHENPNSGESGYRQLYLARYLMNALGKWGVGKSLP